MKFVDDARDAWKWFSVQANALNAAMLAAWLVLPADLKASIPPEWVGYAAVFLLALGTFGRLVDQK
jgi:hypothetical protein